MVLDFAHRFIPLLSPVSSAIVALRQRIFPLPHNSVDRLTVLDSPDVVSLLKPVLPQPVTRPPLHPQ